MEKVKAPIIIRMTSKYGAEKALQMLCDLPRVSLSNLKPLPGTRVKVNYKTIDFQKRLPLPLSRLHVLR